MKGRRQAETFEIIAIAETSQTLNGFGLSNGTRMRITRPAGGVYKRPDDLRVRDPKVSANSAACYTRRGGNERKGMAEREETERKMRNGEGERERKKEKNGKEWQNSMQ